MQSVKIVGTYVKNLNLRDEIVKCIPDMKITGFQLKDIMRLNFTAQKIKIAIAKQLMQKTKFDKDIKIITE